jgi:uncharacterized protein
MAESVTTTSILWRRLDQPGHDSALMHEHATGAVIEGSAVFAESGRPCRLDYRVTCDATWRTLSARVTGWHDTKPVNVSIESNDRREWTLNGAARPDLLGSEDVDLSFTPATNVLPIRRSRLALGSRVSVRAAWLRFPELTLEPLDQTYERTAEMQYRYESRGGSFVAVLDTNSVGLVTHYPRLWRVEEATR